METPMYVIGDLVNPNNVWISRCKVSDAGEIYIDGAQMKPGKTPISEGTYGKVYKYTQGNKRCAVKFFKSPKKLCVCELGYNIFPGKTWCREGSKIIYTAIYTKVHIMELGKCTFKDKIHVRKMVNSIRGMASNFITHTMSYTDFKQLNLIWIMKGKTPVARVCDLDGIGCVNTQLQQNCVDHTNRYSTYPIIKGPMRGLWNFPAISILQTWYSAIITALLCEFQAHKQDTFYTNVHSTLTHTNNQPTEVYVLLSDSIGNMLEPILTYLHKIYYYQYYNYCRAMEQCKNLVQSKCIFDCITRDPHNIQTLQDILLPTLQIIKR